MELHWKLRGVGAEWTMTVAASTPSDLQDNEVCIDDWTLTPLERYGDAFPDVVALLEHYNGVG